MNRFSRIWISGLVTVTALSLALIASDSLVGLTKVNAVSPQQRTYEITAGSFPEDIVRVSGVRNLQSALFPVDLEIEIENLSNKRIYFISISLDFPESRPFTPHRKPLGFPLKYGDARLSDIREIATSQDKPVEPGGRYTLKLNASQAKGVQWLIAHGELPISALSKIRIHFQVISFGDGTGYLVGSPYPVPKVTRENQTPKIQGGPILDQSNLKNSQGYSIDYRFEKLTSLSGTQGIFSSLLPRRYIPESNPKNTAIQGCWEQSLVWPLVCYGLCRLPQSQDDGAAPKKTPCQYDTQCDCNPPQCDPPGPVWCTYTWLYPCPPIPDC